jgi:hypothetical protein
MGDGRYDSPMAAADDEFEIRPVADENYEGRQWGYEIVKDGEVVFTATTGGTGPCWNLGEDPRSYADPTDAGSMHICDLDEAIAALKALRDSAAHRQNVARWD